MNGEPESAVRDEASGFAAYLSYYREQIVEGVSALTPEEQGTTRIPSQWTPIQLLSHVLHMERRWFVWGFLAEDVVDPWGDWDREQPSDVPPGEPQPRCEVPDQITAEDLVPLLRDLGERTTRILAERDLDEVAPPSLRWDHTNGIPTLRWICFHVLQEYARHAGHLDIAVELAHASAGVEEEH
jgi:hypothetical protein